MVVPFTDKGNTWSWVGDQEFEMHVRHLSPIKVAVGYVNLVLGRSQAKDTNLGLFSTKRGLDEITQVKERQRTKHWVTLTFKGQEELAKELGKQQKDKRKTSKSSVMVDKERNNFQEIVLVNCFKC